MCVLVYLPCILHRAMTVIVVLTGVWDLLYIIIFYENLRIVTLYIKEIILKTGGKTHLHMVIHKLKHDYIIFKDKTLIIV